MDEIAHCDKGKITKSLPMKGGFLLEIKFTFIISQDYLTTNSSPLGLFVEFLLKLLASVCVLA